MVRSAAGYVGITELPGKAFGCYYDRRISMFLLLCVGGVVSPLYVCMYIQTHIYIFGCII